MSPQPDRWSLAMRAAAALTVDQVGLCGLSLRARPGPVRDRFLEVLVEFWGRPALRLPAGNRADALTGGLDLGASLRSGSPVTSAGLIERAAGELLIAPMAERMEPGIAALVGHALDEMPRPALILLDESAEEDEAPSSALTDRLAIFVDLDGVAWSEASAPAGGSVSVEEARARLAAGIDDGGAVAHMAALALGMGIPSLRAPILALRLARVLAALDGVDRIAEPQIALAAALALAPRATMWPGTVQEEQPETTDPPSPPDDRGEAEEQRALDGPLQDRVLDAVAALLPDLNLSAGRQRGGRAATGSGDRRKSAQHGRPVRSLRGKPQGARLDLYGTLMAAAPWQRLRRQMASNRKGIIVTPDDFRIRQYERPSESVLVFLVDASGSQAAARMAEAKGAVELMLAEAYRRREKVALIAFRHASAELILPPTRSLLQAKRRLAVLPGGGPTPLPTALTTGRELAGQLRRRGATPYLILLTDGRGNIALDGEPGRARSAIEQEQIARTIAALGIRSVLIDTGNRPREEARVLATALDGEYLPLPRADAEGISRIVRSRVVQ